MKEISGKVVLITGASGGIGEATAKAFDREGAKVVLVSRNKKKLDEIAAGLKDVLVIPADLDNTEEAVGMIDQTIQHYGKIDIVIHNAAAIIVAPSDSVHKDDLLRAFRTNLIAPVAATQRAYEAMKKQGCGHIIMIGSPGYMMGIPYYSPYVCSKAALSAWTRTIQAEWNTEGIHISEYFPGYVKTGSKPESRIGEVGQDFLMSPKQNFITREFAKPKTTDEIAKQLVKLARKPKTLVYSGFGVHLGAYISNISSFRLSIARQMAATGRRKIAKGI